MEMYRWQKEAIEFFFNNRGKSIYEVSTGVGKTLLAVELIKSIMDKDPNCRFLIIVPKNVILEDTWFRQLYEYGISLKDVGVFYGSIKEIAKITITNMQSVSRIPMELFRENSCLVADEIHSFSLRMQGGILSFPFKYMIGLTATLERKNNEHYTIMKAFDYNVYKYTPKQAMKEGLLNPFDFTNISVELDSQTKEAYDLLTHRIRAIYKMKDDSGNRVESNILLGLLGERKKMVNNCPEKMDIVLNLCRKHIGSKMIVFNEYNSQTNKLYWHLIEGGVQKVCMIHSKMKQSKRDENLAGFRRDKYDIILATKVLDEGFNLPSVSVSIVAASNSTQRQNVQRMGRVLRRKVGISALYQIYCSETIEEKYAMARTEFFKPLCNHYSKV